MPFAAVRSDANGRLCCKSRFALVIKILLGCRRDFRVAPPDKRSRSVLQKQDTRVTGR